MNLFRVIETRDTLIRDKGLNLKSTEQDKSFFFNPDLANLRAKLMP